MIFTTMKHLLIYLMIVFLSACSSQTRSNLNDSNQTSEIEQNHDSTDVENTLFVDYNCVIFLFPDSFEIAEMRANTTEDDYNEIIADMMWYPGIASEFLDSLEIKYIYCNKEFLVLIKSDNTEIKLTRKDIEGNMVLFNIDKEPFISYAISFDKESTLEYFDLK